MRAAEYLRTSSNHQERSLEYQAQLIRQYASATGYEIVRSYVDENRSGLDLAHRPGLQDLLHDIVSFNSEFEALLVFDVTRWGRFQNPDESACYEFLCRRSGVQVHYCGDVFLNDGSSSSAILKSLRRIMAGEYIRDLSERTSRAQTKIARSGFKLGGSAGFGLRRVLLDENGSIKCLLADGERKSLARDRVTYRPGPPEEVAVVKEIFHRFVECGWSIWRIARDLAPRAVPRPRGGKWDFQAVYKILSHPKYAGCIVFNRTSEQFRSKAVTNPRQEWIIRRGSFKPLVSPELFERAQLKFSERTARRTDEELLRALQMLLQTQGRLSETLINRCTFTASANTYRLRFGSLAQAYKRVQTQSNQQWHISSEEEAKVVWVKTGSD